MRWGAWWLLLVPLPTIAHAAETTIFVKNATVAPDLSDRLRDELPPVAFARTASAADLTAELSVPLRLRIRDRSGITLVDRVLEGGRDAAVRVAVLLIAEAQKSWRPPIPPVPPPVRTSTGAVAAVGWRLGGLAGAGLSMWTTEATPLLLVALSGYAGFGDLEIGLDASFTTFVAGGVETASLRGAPRAFAGAIEGRWWFWRPAASLGVSLWAAAGYQYEWVRAQVIGGFATGTVGPLETRTFHSPVGRAGLGLEVLLDRIPVRLDVGVFFQPEARVALPDPYTEAQGAEIARGVALPWGRITIGIERLIDRTPPGNP